MSILTWISMQHFLNNFWKNICVMHTLQYEHVLTFWCNVTYLYIPVIRIRIRLVLLPIKGPQGANNLIQWLKWLETYKDTCKHDVLCLINYIFFSVHHYCVHTCLVWHYDTCSKHVWNNVIFSCSCHQNKYV